MRVQHNITAMNSYRNYNTNNSKLGKNLEKLSSGYSINRAGDNAAGLAISEKMRAQITGLEVAQKNANDGISLVQTAEGALTEVHDMLNRMYELADQSANGTYEDGVDRAQLQKEVEQLKNEINRIADSANFNGIYLLNGSLEKDFSSSKSTSTATEQTVASLTALDGVDKGLDEGTDVSATLSVTYNPEAAGAAATAAKFEATTAAAVDTSSAAVTSVTVGGNDLTVNIAQNGDDDAIKTAVEGALSAITGYTAAVEVSSGNVTVTWTRDEAGAVSDSKPNLFSAYTGTWTNGTDAGAGTAASGDYTLTIGDKTFTASGEAVAAGSEIELTSTDDTSKKVTITVGDAITADVNDEEIAKVTTENVSGSPLTLQIGDTSDDYNKMVVSVKDTHTTSLGSTDSNGDVIAGKTLADVNIGTQDGAAAACDILKAAINQVSDIRGGLGATQNRLEHTISNLSVMQENLQNAESVIRDTDVADEMMAYTKNSILNQSAQAMLAQANQLPQGVLQLLQ